MSDKKEEIKLIGKDWVLQDWKKKKLYSKMSEKKKKSHIQIEKTASNSRDGLKKEQVQHFYLYPKQQL